MNNPKIKAQIQDLNKIRIKIKINILFFLIIFYFGFYYFFDFKFEKLSPQNKVNNLLSSNNQKSTTIIKKNKKDKKEIKKKLKKNKKDQKEIKKKLKKNQEKKYKIYAINYATASHYERQLLNTLSAIKIGKVDKVLSYFPKDIDKEFYEKNKHIFNYTKGGGYFIWKPYFIYKAMKENIKEGDYIVYCDCDTVYINNTQYLINYMKRKKSDILSFIYNPEFLEKQWSKRDAFILMDSENENIINSPQIIATYFVLKKNNFTENFVLEWLKYCQDRRIVTDEPNVLGKSNYESFIENRYDQTVFSLLLKKKYGIYGERNAGTFLLPLIQITKEEAKNASNFPTSFFHYDKDFQIQYKDYSNKEIQDYIKSLKIFNITE